MTARRPFPRSALLALGLLTLTVGGAALAWACTPAANVAVAGAGGAGSVLPGGQMDIAVAQYSKDADVTVHWGDLGGQVLASGKGPEFTASVPVPNVPDGNYTVFARAIDDKGELRVARAPVIVGEPGT